MSACPPVPPVPPEPPPPDVPDTVTVTLFCTEPPSPEQLSVYVEVAESGPTVRVSFVLTEPLHAPEAVQLVALLLTHVSVELLPLVIVVGLAESDSVGAGVDGGGVCVVPL